MITMGIVWVLDIKKVAYELSGPFAKVGPPQADNGSNKPPENFRKKNVFFNSFDLNKLYIYGSF